MRSWEVQFSEVNLSEAAYLIARLEDRDKDYLLGAEAFRRLSGPHHLTASLLLREYG